MTETLTVGDLTLEVRWSARRQTLGLTVERGGELAVSAPEGCPLRTLEAYVREKRFWIYQKLAAKEALPTGAPAKEYVDGEGFPYLGRSYRLLLVDDQAVPVKLEQGRFKLRRADVRGGHGREHLVVWYAAHARPWLAERVERFRGRVGVVPSGVTVQDLGYRWGSCGKGARLYFHWRTMLLPPRIAEYIVVHELVHLREAHHTPEFWRRVERAMADFGVRKRWLAERGREVAGV
ncbi:MAG: M48 family metallopeptidase [Polyangiaceae bacterium]|nr:M48 family metallopeptidase [Polyangiaceae bacterium]